MKTTLTIIAGLNAAVVAGLIYRGTADGVIERMIKETIV